MRSRITVAMLSAFTARPILELRQRDKSKIESILAYGTAMDYAKIWQILIISRGSTVSRTEHRKPTNISSKRTTGRQDERERIREARRAADIPTKFIFRRKASGTAS